MANDGYMWRTFLNVLCRTRTAESFWMNLFPWSRYKTRLLIKQTWIFSKPLFYASCKSSSFRKFAVFLCCFKSHLRRFFVILQKIRTTTKESSSKKEYIKPRMARTKEKRLGKKQTRVLCSIKCFYFFQLWQTCLL